MPPPIELQNARFAELTAQPHSRHCTQLCEGLLAKLLRPSGQRVNKARCRAFGALVADLLERDPEDFGGWLYRSMRANSFTGGPVGYRPFETVLAVMKGLMVDFVAGTRQYTKSELTGGVRQPTWSRAARFRANDWMRNWFAEQGITRESWGEHFAREKPKNLPNQSSLALRATKRRRSGTMQYGRSLPLNLDDNKIVALRDRMDRLNSFLWEQSIEPYGPVFLRRIFANGDQEGFNWQTGGRLTAIGSETFQTAKKADRASVLINGLETVEIDIQASHLTILAGLGYIDEKLLIEDPYVVEAVPRAVVKQWVTMTLGYGRRHRRWPKGVTQTFADKYGINLVQDFPIRATGDAILSKLPILGGGGEVAPVDWGLLQFLESEALMRAVEVLAFDHGIPSLPVHDSLIVPQAMKELATVTLKESYRTIVGVEPVVKEG